MKNRILCILILSFVYPIFGNIRYINYRSFPDYSNLEQDILFIIKNEYYMESWVPEWNYDINKNDLIEKVLEVYNKLSNVLEQNEDNIDLCLFLGDVAHFLYNLDAEGDFFKIANMHYEAARNIESRDYRSYWFQGFHLVQSLKPVEGMEKFLYCETAMPPLKMAPHFWQEYAICAYQSQMIFHAQKAISYYNQTRKEEPSSSIQSVFNSINEKLKLVEVNSFLSQNEIWSKIQTDKGKLSTSYLYGIKFLLPAKWEVGFNDVKNGLTAVVLKPPKYNGYDDMKVGVTILMLMKVNQGIPVDQFAQSLLRENYSIAKQPVDIDQPNVISYSIQANDIYTDQGGGKMFLIVFEKESPEFPGILLEEPRKLEPKNENEISYFTLDTIYKRFSDPILYAFLLDSCESIYDEAYSDYIDFIKNDITVE